ncbi:hypothetical protein [Novosphingobium terrae]|uniref:hypothetical protein n=1 Tax=Novosphingobium terrae TaxID=2726189 RepID=UPI00197FE2A2|nr:hypothetical protein [Novosphingobium terrae]
MIRAGIAAAAFLAPSLAFGQSAMVVGSVTTNVIHAGTSIELETREELSTEGKHLKVGKRFEMDVLQPVLLNGQVVIPAGSHAVGEVVTVRNKGMWGKSGGVTARVLYVEANGRQIRINGTFNDRGETGTAGVIASVALVPVAGFFVTGTSAKIAPGTRVLGFIAEEVPVEFAGAKIAAAPAAAAVVSPPSAAPAALPVASAPVQPAAVVSTAGVATEGGTVTKAIPPAS